MTKTLLEKAREEQMDALDYIEKLQKEQQQDAGSFIIEEQKAYQQGKVEIKK